MIFEFEAIEKIYVSFFKCKRACGFWHRWLVDTILNIAYFNHFAALHHLNCCGTDKKSNPDIDLFVKTLISKLEITTTWNSLHAIRVQEYGANKCR